MRTRSQRAGLHTNFVCERNRTPVWHCGTKPTAFEGDKFVAFGDLYTILYENIQYDNRKYYFPIRKVLSNLWHCYQEQVMHHVHKRNFEL